MNKYRFPIWFRIYPDENIVSWLEALFSVNGMSKKAFSVTLEGSTELLELENICRKYEVLITKLIANTVFKLNCTHN